jgi:hypothetical protein
MMISVRVCNTFLLIFCLVASSVVVAKSASDSDQLDEQDRQEFNLRIDRANTCIQSRNFACAEKQLGQAKSYANGSRDRRVLQKTMESLELQRQLALRDDAKNKYAGEREVVESNAENAQSETDARRQRALADARESSARQEESRQAARDRERKEDRRQPKDDILGGLRETIESSNRMSEITNRSVAEINRRAAEEERARAHLQQEKREQAAQRRRDDERDRNSRLASADAQRERDQRAERERAREAEQRRQREEQAAADRRAREQEQARLQEERRQQAARAAEEKRAEEKRKADYLAALRQGIRLKATKCPDGEGLYYVTGSMPRIKEELGCVDVYYRASCPGSAVSSNGVIKTFVPGGCFSGDAATIAPKPACAVEQVRVEVSDVRRGCN